MTDDTDFFALPPPRSLSLSESLAERYKNLPPLPPSLRLGTPKEIGHQASERHKLSRRDNNNFAHYLADLKDDQKSLFGEKSGYRKKSLRHQMDLLDALFTYLAVNADWKRETPQAYNAALRAQKQFCDTIKTMAGLKKSTTPKTSSKPVQEE